MKHYMCTHTLSNKNDVEDNWQPTDREFLEFFSSERAYVIQHWRGTDDFFFCHWMAESTDAINEQLSQMNDFFEPHQFTEVKEEVFDFNK